MEKEGILWTRFMYLATGNPDTDSVVSAMAYAALHNSLGDREYVPARLGS